MCVWRKTPNLLRFCLFGKGLGLAVAVGFGSFCPELLLAADSLSRIAEKYRASMGKLSLDSEFKDAAGRCLQVYLDEFNKFKVKGKDLGELEPKAACPTNHNNGHLTNHNRAAGKTKTTGSIAGTEVKITYDGLGHCEASFQAMKETYLALVDARGRFCKDLFENINTRANCLSKSGQTNCDTAYKDVTQDLDVYKAKILGSHAEAETFLRNFPRENENAKKKYEEDREKIRAFESRNPSDPANLTRFGLMNKIELAPGQQVDPQNGGVSTIGEYLQRLDGGLAKEFSLAGLRAVNPSPGPLIAEHELAKRKLAEFHNALDRVRSKGDGMFAELSAKMKGYKAPEVGSEEWHKYVAAAGPLTGLINQNQPPGRPAVSDLGGSVPALLAAGVAGASLGRASVPASQSQLPQAPGTPAASPAGTNLFAGADAPAAGNPATPALPGADDNAPKTTADAGPNTFIPPGANFLSAGASSNKGKFKRPPPRSPASGGAATTASAGGEEMFKPFQADLRPSPAGKKSDGMGEVSSLLGQMKNLFNFEEGMGMQGPAMSPFGATGSPGSGGTAAASFSEDYAADDYESGSAEAPGEVQASGAIGSSGTSLFARVHSRHRICMEKGWVLSGIGGIPE